MYMTPKMKYKMERQASPNVELLFESMMYMAPKMRYKMEKRALLNVGGNHRRSVFMESSTSSRSCGNNNVTSTCPESRETTSVAQIDTSTEMLVDTSNRQQARQSSVKTCMNSAAKMNVEEKQGWSNAVGNPKPKRSVYLASKQAVNTVKKSNPKYRPDQRKDYRSVSLRSTHYLARRRGGNRMSRGVILRHPEYNTSVTRNDTSIQSLVDISNRQATRGSLIETGDNRNGYRSVSLRNAN